MYKQKKMKILRNAFIGIIIGIALQALVITPSNFLGSIIAADDSVNPDQIEAEMQDKLGINTGDLEIRRELTNVLAGRRLLHYEKALNDMEKEEKELGELMVAEME